MQPATSQAGPQPAWCLWVSEVPASMGAGVLELSTAPVCSGRKQHDTAVVCCAGAAMPTSLPSTAPCAGPSPPGLQPGVKIVSASYGGPYDGAFGKGYIDMLKSKGIMLVTAAGEAGSTVQGPGLLWAAGPEGQRLASPDRVGCMNRGVVGAAWAAGRQMGHQPCQCC